MSPNPVEVPDAQVAGDLDACAAFATGEGADTARLGITGFCWGGRQVWLYAERNPSLKAAVVWYGPLVNKPTELQPKHAIDDIADLKCPVLWPLHGGADPSIPPEAVKAIKAAADKAGKTVEVVIYPDAGHAFNADFRPSYREGPAKDGWKRMQAWFKDHGLGPRRAAEAASLAPGSWRGRPTRS